MVRYLMEKSSNTIETCGDCNKQEYKDKKSRDHCVSSEFICWLQLDGFQFPSVSSESSSKLTDENCSRRSCAELNWQSRPQMSETAVI